MSNEIKFTKSSPVYIDCPRLTQRPPHTKFIDGTPTLLYILGFARWIWNFLADSKTPPVIFLNPKPKNIFAKFLQSTPTPELCYNYFMENTKRYIGKDCLLGHGGERYTSNWRCVRCHQLKKQAIKKAKRAANPKKRGRPAGYGVDKTTEEYKEFKRIRSREYARTERGKAIRKEYEKTPKSIAFRKAQKAKYRSAKLNRMPAWLTKNDKWMIEQAYDLATLRTKLFGFTWEVDHIIPLQGKTVSGLHVPTNLQVIPKLVNARKGNKFLANFA